MTNTDDIVYRLRKRAEIRRQIPTRKSVQEGARDRLADLLEEAADVIEKLRSPSILDAAYNPLTIQEDYFISYMPYDAQWAKHQGPFTDSEEGRKSDFCQACQQLIWYDECVPGRTKP